MRYGNDSVVAMSSLSFRSLSVSQFNHSISKYEKKVEYSKKSEEYDEEQQGALLLFLMMSSFNGLILTVDQHVSQVSNRH